MLTHHDLIPIREEIRAQNLTLENRLSCFYCSQSSQCEDHAIPHSLTHGQRSNRKGYRKDTLPACNECNALLGSLVFNSLDARRAHLAKVYRKRLSRWVNGEAWTEAEISELGERMRLSALAFNAEKKNAERRLQHLLGERAPIALPLEVENKPRATRAKPSRPCLYLWQGTQIETRERVLDGALWTLGLRSRDLPLPVCTRGLVPIVHFARHSFAF